MRVQHPHQAADQPVYLPVSQLTIAKMTALSERPCAYTTLSAARNGPVDSFYDVMGIVTDVVQPTRTKTGRKVPIAAETLTKPLLISSRIHGHVHSSGHGPDQGVRALERPESA